MSDSKDLLSSSAIQNECVVAAPASVENEVQDCIRIGPEYQADVPLLPFPTGAVDSYEAIDIVQWIPSPYLSDSTLDVYVQRSKELYRYEEEQALGMLYFHDYNLDKAFADHINYVPEEEEWTDAEKVMFKEAFKFHGKDFDKYANILPSKSQGDIIKFYYLTKKHKKKRRGSSPNRVSNSQSELALKVGNIDNDSPDYCREDAPSDASHASTMEATHDEDVIEPSNEVECLSQGVIRSEICQNMSSVISGDKGFLNPDASNNRSRTEEDQRRVSGLPPSTFLQLLGCSKCSLYFGTSRSQKVHMERAHGSRVFTPIEAAFDFDRLKASAGADQLLTDCACIACGVFFLDPTLKKKHLAKMHPEVKHEAVRTRLPFDLSPAHTSHNHLQCNECALSFSSSRLKYEHNQKVHSVKFDFPDINETLAEESSLSIENERQNGSNGTTSLPYSVTPTPTWSNREVVEVLEAIRLHGPNFFLIAGKIPSKNVNQIRKFYFLNKRRYNLDRMDRKPSSMGEGSPATEKGAKERVEGGGGGGGGVTTAKIPDSLVGPAEYRRAVSSPSFIGADCGDSTLPSDDGTPIIPPEPRPFRRARQAGKYVQKTKILSSEEEDVVESEEEKKSVSDDESSDPNFEGEEEEVSDDSDTEHFGKGRKKKNNCGKMLGSSSGTVCNFEAMKGTFLVTPKMGTTFRKLTATATSTTATTVKPCLSSPSATVAPLPTGSTTSSSAVTVSAVGTQPAFVEESTSASASSPSRRQIVVMKQLPDGFSYGFHHNAISANSSSASTYLVQKETQITSSSGVTLPSIVPSMQPFYKRTSMYHNMVEFYPPTRPIASDSKAVFTSDINLVGARGTSFYASSSFSLETNGPARAVAVHPGECWKGGNDALPQNFEVQLNDAKVAGQLGFRVIEGVSSKSEFADPSCFRFEARMSPSTEWVPLFMISNAAQHKGRDLVFNFDNRVPFNFYRMVIFKTMSNHPKAKPTIGGLRLMECFFVIQSRESIWSRKMLDKLN